MQDIPTEQKPTREVVKLHFEACEILAEDPDFPFLTDTSMNRGHHLHRLQRVGGHFDRTEGNATLSVFHKPSKESRSEQGPIAKAP